MSVSTVVLGACVIVTLRQPNFCGTVKDSIHTMELTVLRRTAVKRTSEGKYSCACHPEWELKREVLMRKLSVLTSKLRASKQPQSA